MSLGLSVIIFCRSCKSAATGNSAKMGRALNLLANAMPAAAPIKNVSRLLPVWLVLYANSKVSNTKKLRVISVV